LKGVHAKGLLLTQLVYIGRRKLNEVEEGVKLHVVAYLRLP